MARKEITKPEEALFGNQTSANLLIALGMLRSGSISDLARVAGSSRSVAMRVVDRWERADLVTTRLDGRNRVVEFSPRLRFDKALSELLEKLAQLNPEIEKRAAAIRRRPRRKGKELNYSDEG